LRALSAWWSTGHSASFGGGAAAAALWSTGQLPDARGGAEFVGPIAEVVWPMSEMGVSGKKLLLDATADSKCKQNKRFVPEMEGHHLENLGR
jgi:hypothetical protein